MNIYLERSDDIVRTRWKIVRSSSKVSGDRRKLTKGIGGLSGVRQELAEGDQGLVGSSVEAYEGIKSLQGWCKGVRHKKTETRWKIVEVAEKLAESWKGGRCTA
ncbi:hypothetical protein BHM03_00040881 [Ensete ventricosum]|nr:hypothetical protein BHM03_00040881 [Ensete ventricosum]